MLVILLTLTLIAAVVHYIAVKNDMSSIPEQSQTSSSSRFSRETAAPKNKESGQTKNTRVEEMARNDLEETVLNNLASYTEEPEQWDESSPLFLCKRCHTLNRADFTLCRECIDILKDEHLLSSDEVDEIMTK